jgi:Domain of unknown function (DUF4124)
MSILRFHLLLVLLALLALSTSAAAQDAIHRCVGADGNPLFTDQPCAALHAMPVSAAQDSTNVQVPPGAALPINAAPPPVLCAASLGELRQSVLEAFASHNPNRLAGLMLWGGYGRDAVVADIRSMTALMQRPLLDVDEDDGDAPPAAPDTVSMPPPAERQIVIRTAGNDGSGAPHETHFDVVRRSGCLWLRNSG